MSAETDIHAALMAQAETITGFVMVWPGRGDDEPSGEHVKVFHLPNESDRAVYENGGPSMRQGILQLSMFSVPGQYEITYRTRADELLPYFPEGFALIGGVAVYKRDVGQGRNDGQHWLTPVRIYYRGLA